ncbi:MAG TPA: murein L,D-transpeptidase catalytic domain family protein [Thermoanaerobaculia bacterium]|nr:murein L,D-transpeptidase catalytic domain family protein [Thermoanaerobaculia bacterium]
MTPKHSSAPAVAPKINSLRSWGRKLTLPAILLTAVAASPFAKLTELPSAYAASVPEPVHAVATVPEAIAAPAPEPEIVAPIVTPPTAEPVTPSVTTAFAHGVPGLSPKVLTMALDAVSSARANGVSGRDDLLTVIDYSLPSTKPRLWVLDVAKGEVLFHELVAHGAGSGDNYATRFSNVKDSRQTSLGLFLTGGTYEGGNGYSLKLQGLDRGINDLAEERHIVMHGAWYVNPEHARGHGRIGRSWGCPALSEQVASTVIDTIKGGSFIFSYSAADPAFLRTTYASHRTTPSASIATTALSR